MISAEEKGRYVSKPKLQQITVGNYAEFYTYKPRVARYKKGTKNMLPC